MTQIILLLQLALTLLTQAQTGTPEQKLLASQIATQAVQMASAYIAQPTGPTAPKAEPTLPTGPTQPVERISEPVISVQTIAPVRHSISVSMDSSTVAINNTSPVPIRISKIGLDEGKALSLTLGSITYQTIFSASGPTFNLFDCTGLGSLGIVPAPGNSRYDPCARMNESYPKNELKPGERASIRTTGSSLIKDQTIIVEVATGQSLDF